jgi:hypothetical protein
MNIYQSLKVGSTATTSTATAPPPSVSDADRLYRVLIVMDPTRARDERDLGMHHEWSREVIEGADRYLNDPELKGYVFAAPSDGSRTMLLMHEKVYNSYFLCSVAKDFTDRHVGEMVQDI